jgi:hypothetical protein
MKTDLRTFQSRGILNTPCFQLFKLFVVDVVEFDGEGSLISL